MINGRVKFFERSLARLDAGVRVASDDNTDARVLFNERQGERWVSTVNSDTTSVRLTITINEIGSFNRIIINNHNMASFDIAVNRGFSNATDINNRPILELNPPRIRVRNNSLRTSYFAFDSVRTPNTILIGLLGTFPANQNKTIGQVIVTNEIGTLEGYPVISNIDFEDNSRQVKSKGGATFITKQSRTLKKIPLQFQNYTKIKDIELMETLQRRDEPFLIWPGGGDESQFRFPTPGVRLVDIYKVQTLGLLKTRYKHGSYAAPPDATMNFVESI